MSCYRRGAFIACLMLFLLLSIDSWAIEDESTDDLPTAYLKILESGVDFFEPIYTEALTDAPDAGFYDIREYQNWTHPRNEAYHTLCMIPGNGQVVLTYAVLLKYSKKKRFGIAGYPRELLLEHARRVIRWICLTSTYVQNPYAFLPEVRFDLAAGKQWHRKWGLRQDLFGYLSLGVALLWDDLDTETRSLFRQVATGMAVRGRLPRTVTEEGNGNHDQVKQDLSSTIAAAYLFPDHPDHEKFQEFLEGAGLDMVGTEQDFSSQVQLESGLLKEQVRAVNMNPDYSSLHHNHPSVWYGIDLIFEGRSYVELMAAITGGKVPDTFNYKGNGFDGVYKYAVLLATDDGLINRLRDPEYDSSYGAGLLAFCYGNKHNNDPGAKLLEQGAADLLARHTAAVGEYDYHRGSWAKTAMAYLWHQKDGGRLKAETATGAVTPVRGSFHLASLNTFINRSSDAWIAFVWGTDKNAGGGGQGAYIMPAKAGGPLIYNRSDTLTGTILQHRPFWLYGTFAGILLFAGLGGMFFSSRLEQLSELSFFIMAAGAVALLLIAWIDFYHTLPVRIPRAVVPGGLFAVVSAVAALNLLIFIVKKKGERTTLPGVFVENLPHVLLVIPCTLLLMTRSPFDVLFSFAEFSSSTLLYLLILLLCITATALVKRGQKTAGFYVAGLVFILLLLSLSAIIAGSTIDQLYLRLVSIRNVPRIISFFMWASIPLGVLWIIYLGFYRILPLFITKIFIVIIFSVVSVAALSFNRFDRPRISDISHSISDDGFATAGRSQTSHSEIRQAFFSYAGGFGLTFVDVIGKTNALVTWSGVPVSFYQRDSFVDSRFVTTAHGKAELKSVTTKSSWWCVDSLLAGAFVDDNDSYIEGSTQLGKNWARTEAYLDRVNILSMTPRNRQFMHKGEIFQRSMLMLATNVDQNQIKQLSENVYRLDNQLNDGWMGALATTIRHAKVLAVANLSLRQGTSQLLVSDDGWSPVFASEGKTSALGTTLEVTLMPFATLREESYLDVKVAEGENIRLQKISNARYAYSVEQNGPIAVKLKWNGPALAKAVLQTSNGVKNLSGELLASAAGEEVLLQNQGDLFLSFVSAMDYMPPFVEVDEPVLQQGDRLNVTVKASDQSGVSSVKLLVDGVELSTLKQPPYLWSIPRTGEIHSFQALAVDASPEKNQQLSFVSIWKAKKRE